MRHAASWLHSDSLGGRFTRMVPSSLFLLPVTLPPLLGRSALPHLLWQWHALFGPVIDVGQRGQGTLIVDAARRRWVDRYRHLAATVSVLVPVPARGADAAAAAAAIVAAAAPAAAKGPQSRAGRLSLVAADLECDGVVTLFGVVIVDCLDQRCQFRSRRSVEVEDTCADRIRTGGLGAAHAI